MVRGARAHQYAAKAPPNSFIDASQFSTAEKLAAYLSYLLANQTAYLEYFKWKLTLYDRFLIRKFSVRTDDDSNDSNSDQSKLTQSSSSLQLGSSKKDLFDYNQGYQKRIDKMHVPFCAICSMVYNETYMNNPGKNRKWLISDWFAKSTNCWDANESRYLLYKIAQFVGFCF